MSIPEKAPPLKHAHDALRAPAGAWIRFATLLLPVVGIVVLFLPTFEGLARRWNDGETGATSQGWLIVALCLWLLYRAAKQLQSLRLNPQPLVAAALIAFSFVWLLAVRTGIEAAAALLLPIIAVASVGALFGYRVMRACVFPLGYFYFAMPAWGLLNPILQWGSVFAVRLLIRLFGVPATFIDNNVRVPAGTFTIEGGCSGLHFFIVGVALAILYGELQRNSLRRRVQLVLIGAALSFLCNWTRVFTIVVAGHLTNMQHYVVSVEHNSLGTILFAVYMGVFFWIVSRLKDDVAPAESAGVSQPNQATSERRGALGATVVLLSVAVLCGPVWNAMVVHIPRAMTHSSLLPEAPAGWNGPLPQRSSWRPVFEGADVHAMGRYETHSHEVELFRAEYAQQQQGEELNGYENTPLGEHAAEQAGLVMTNGLAERRVIDKAGESALIWYGYYVGTRWFDSAFSAQLWYGLRSLFGAPLSGVVALRASCSNDCENARERLALFAERAQLRSVADIHDETHAE